MNSGIIAGRYARALLKRVTETGRGPQVCRQVEQMLARPEIPVGDIEPDLQSFVDIVIKNGRQEYLKLALSSFLRKYYEANHIKMASLKTAVPAPELETRLRTLILEKTGCEIKLKTEVDPKIIGGFIFIVDDLMLDASVIRQIEVIKRQFIGKTNRIV